MKEHFRKMLEIFYNHMEQFWKKLIDDALIEPLDKYAEEFHKELLQKSPEKILTNPWENFLRKLLQNF